MTARSQQDLDGNDPSIGLLLACLVPVIGAAALLLVTRLGTTATGIEPAAEGWDSSCDNNNDARAHQRSFMI